MDDSVLKYKFKSEPTGRKGALKKFDGLVDIYNFDPNNFSLDFSNQKMTIYSLVVYSKDFLNGYQIEFLYRDAKQFTGFC